MKITNFYHIFLWHLFVTVNLLFSSWSFCCHGKTDCLIFQEKSLPAPSVSVSSQIRQVLEHITHILGDSGLCFDVLFICRKGEDEPEVLETGGP